MLKIKMKAIVQDDPYDITPFTVSDVADASTALRLIEEAPRRHPPYSATVIDENLRELSIDEVKASAAREQQDRDKAR